MQIRRRRRFTWDRNIHVPHFVAWKWLLNALWYEKLLVHDEGAVSWVKERGVLTFSKTVLKPGKRGISDFFICRHSKKTVQVFTLSFKISHSGKNHTFSNAASKNLVSVVSWIIFVASLILAVFGWQLQSVNMYFCSLIPITADVTRTNRILGSIGIETFQSYFFLPTTEHKIPYYQLFLSISGKSIKV